MKSRQEIERLSRQKMKKRLLLILLCVMVLAVTAAIILVNLIPDDPASQTEKKDPPEVLEGESVYNNYPIAYPTIQESQIQQIIVTNKASYKDDYSNPEDIPVTSYMLDRNKEANGKFVLTYQGKDGKSHKYYPSIVEMDASFDYESLYSIEGGDGYGRIYKLTYLCVALELPYFTDRIALLPEGDARNSQLAGFGLDDPQSTIRFAYTYVEKDASGNDVEKIGTRKIVIGDKNVTGVGYYFMVDDRPYIYSSMANYYDYAMLGFYSYVNSILVSAGLAEDSSYEPYLTTDYKQWENKYHDEPGTVIPDGSSVVIYTDVLTPLESVLDVPDSEKKDDVVYDSEVPEANRNGYISDGYTQIEVDLSKKDKYQKFIGTIVGEKLGDFANEIVVTLTSDSKTLNFGELDSLKYDYEIIEIEAILTDKADITEAGYPVLDNKLIRVAYYLSVNGKRVSNIPYHGVIDLSNTALDATAVAAISSSAVGTLNQSITLTVNYSKSNAVKMNIRYVIDEIVAIYNSKGKEISKVAEDSIVYYRWSVLINGVKQGYDNGYADLGDNDNEISKKLKEALVGFGTEKNLSITFGESTAYCEYVKDFMTYKVKRADYFITSELVSAFMYQNNSKRDPFYGESIYENTMDNEYSLYAINSSACEAVAKKLGGIGDTTGSSQGLIGTETVALGLTPEIKKAYDLYDYTIYFELPRGIIVVDSGDDETIDDYDHRSKLGFTLYISEEKYDSETKSYYRFVGSDLYDIVTKVNAEDLEFLNYNFVDFWARKSLMMFDVKFLEEMKVEFMMDDLKGSYSFSIPHASKGDRTFEVRAWENCEHPDGCGCADTKLREMLKDSKIKATTLTAIYNKYLADDEKVYYNSRGDVLYGVNSYDTAGVGYFRSLMAILYATGYEGALDKDEQDAALQSAPLLMRISLSLDMQSASNTTDNTHVYEFYRCDDRRVMVRLYEVDSTGAMTSDGDVTDFYVSTLAFKKIVANYFALLNGETFDSETAYPDLSK